MNPALASSAPDCLLTLAAPPALEEELLDTLLAHPELASGFTVVRGHGMGSHIALNTPMEQVQGRAGRVIVQVALCQTTQWPKLLAVLQKTLPSPQAVYWLVPLLAFGRLGEYA